MPASCETESTLSRLSKRVVLIAEEIKQVNTIRRKTKGIKELLEKLGDRENDDGLLVAPTLAQQLRDTLSPAGIEFAQDSNLVLSPVIRREEGVKGKPLGFTLQETNGTGEPLNGRVLLRLTPTASSQEAKPEIQKIILIKPTGKSSATDAEAVMPKTLDRLVLTESLVRVLLFPPAQPKA